MASDESGIDVNLFGKKLKQEIRSNHLCSEIRAAFIKGIWSFREIKILFLMKICLIIRPKVVNDLAEKESYVIVGRCVNYVFKDRPNTLRVFIHAPWEFRVEQASQKISGSREDVEKFLLKDDKRKQDYYRKFAGGQWSDATNYDLCLNSGKLGFDKCVDAIETQLKIMFGK